MQRWCRIKYRNRLYPGLDQNGQIELYQGSMLGSKTAMGTTIPPEQASDVSPLGTAVYIKQLFNPTIPQIAIGLPHFSFMGGT